MRYKDDQGNKLYGFSQENLEKTNKAIRSTNRLLQVLIVFAVLFLAIFISLLLWLEVNDIFTRLIG